MQEISSLRDTDLFGVSLSGVLVKDHVADLESVRAGFKLIKEQIHTNITVLDDNVNGVLPTGNKLNTMFDLYLEQTMKPTVVGFVDFVDSSMDALDVYFASDGTAVFQLTVQAYGNVSASQRTLKRMEQGISNLADAVDLRDDLLQLLLEIAKLSAHDLSRHAPSALASDA